MAKSSKKSYPVLTAGDTVQFHAGLPKDPRRTGTVVLSLDGMDDQDNYRLRFRVLRTKVPGFTAWLAAGVPPHIFDSCAFFTARRGVIVRVDRPKGRPVYFTPLRDNITKLAPVAPAAKENP